MPKKFGGHHGRESLNSLYFDGIWRYDSDKAVTPDAQDELSDIVTHLFGSLENIDHNQLTFDLDVNWIVSRSHDPGSRDVPPYTETNFELSSPINYNITYGRHERSGKLSVPTSIAIFNDDLESDIADKYDNGDFLGESYFNKTLNKVLSSK
jgi:hypothetical protein